MNDPNSYRHRQSHRLPPKDQLIMGVHAIRELIRYAPEKLIRIYTIQKKSELLSACEELRIPISFVATAELTKMADSDSHQSFVAHIKGRTFLDVRQFVQKMESCEEAFVLMLDQIFDPQNFGALIRCAECLGADAVAWSKNRGSDLTPVAAKSSSGASELIPLIRVSNLADGVEQFKEAGFEIVSAILNPKAESAYGFKYAPKAVLVVGSEGEGIQPLIQKKSNRSIYLPMTGKIESMNVAQTAAALLALKNT